MVYVNSKLNEDEEVVEVISKGEEIVKEVKLCAGCAGVEAPVEAPKPDLKLNLAVANSYHEHARKCPGKKPLKMLDPKSGLMVKVGEEDCKMCQRGVEWFASLNPTTLNYVLGEHGENKLS